ncbi:MAG: hypothetical protein HQL87_04655 [Magnetococcales bacterium]|nr:hypothetical protein [Magnetococcales bacterium]
MNLFQRNELHAGRKEKAGDEVTRKTGFKSAAEYRRATVVVEYGIPELVKAMENSEIAVSSAAVLAMLPREEQKSVLAGGKKAIFDRVRQARNIRKNTNISSEVLLMDVAGSMVSRLDALVEALKDNPSFLPGRAKGLTRYAVIRDALTRGVAELERLAERPATQEEKR